MSSKTVHRRPSYGAASDISHSHSLCLSGCCPVSIALMLELFSCFSRICRVITSYSETSLIRHSMGPENNVGLGGCWIMECLLPYLYVRIGVCTSYNGQIRMFDYRGVRLGRFHCNNLQELLVVDIHTGLVYISIFMIPFVYFCC